MEGNTCENCIYVWTDPTRGNALFCRRYPPTVEMKEFMNNITRKMDSAVVTTYPPVQKEAWCGEHDNSIPFGKVGR